MGARTVYGLVGFLGLGGAVGCGAPGQDEQHMIDSDPVTQALSSDNGMTTINGLTTSNGMVTSNGLMTSNGLATSNGLMTSNGLATSNGLMTSNGGRLTVKYMAKCALPAGKTLSKQDNYGNWHNYSGGLGFSRDPIDPNRDWGQNGCGTQCQEYVTACMLAHLNSTGTQVPIWVNANPNKMPNVGWGMAYQSGSDRNIQEGVYMGNIFTANPPQAYYVKGMGFKGNIPGRLGASSSNPYKPWSGYRVDSSQFFSGVAALCAQQPAGDGIHADYSDCGKSDYAYGPLRSIWKNVVTTYVNANYDNRVSQNYLARTVDFNAHSLGHKTNNAWEVFTSNGFDFSNSVNIYADGKLNVVDDSGRRMLCVRNTDHIVITKNGGEPFSLSALRLHGLFGDGNENVIIRGYKVGSSPLITKTVLVPPGGADTAINWDGLNKVEVHTPNMSLCVDDVKVKT